MNHIVIFDIYILTSNKNEKKRTCHMYSTLGVPSSVAKPHLLEELRQPQSAQEEK